MSSWARRLLFLAGGLLLWWMCRSTGVLPAPLRAAMAFYAITAGVGAVVLFPLRPSLDRVEYAILSAVAGVAIAPVVFDLAGRFHAESVIVPLVFMSSVFLVSSTSQAARVATFRDRVALVAVVSVVCAVALVIAVPRVSGVGGAIRVFGDYDVHDMTYYTAIAGELTHTRPPLSPFLAGHSLVYSYYPLLLMAVVVKVTQVDLLRFSLQWAWPLFATLSSAAVFLACRRMGSLAFACVATVFVFTAEGMAGMLGLVRPDLVASDPMVWSSVFLAPSATWLYYNTWGPALVVVAGAVYALTRIEESRGWAIVAGLLVAVLPQIKVFGYIVMMPALLCATVILWRGRTRVAARLAVCGVTAFIGSLPWIVPLVIHRDESRAFLTPAWLTLPKRMLFKLGLEGTLETWAAWLGLGTAGRTFVLTTAVALFLLGGLGCRWVGVRSLWRAARGADRGPSTAAWTVLAWFVIGAVLLPFVATVQPHPNGVQPYVPGLLFAWVFAIDAWIVHGGRMAMWRWTTLLAAFAISVVPLWHYAAQAAERQGGAPWVTASPDDRMIVRELERLSPDTVVVLHDRPGDPSLISVMAQRRVVIGWSDTVGWADTAESDARAADVDAFFDGRMALAEAQAMLRRLRVTHVIEHLDRDHVQPEVLAYLSPLVKGRSARLYAVPAR